MTKKFCILILACFLLLILTRGCTGKDNTQLPEVPPNGEGNSGHGLANLDIASFASGLDKILQANGMTGWYDLYYQERTGCYSFRTYDFDNITIYHSIADMGLNVIICYDKLRDEWNVVDLDWQKYGYYNIQQIQLSPDDPDSLLFICESIYSDGGYTFRNYHSRIYYSISEKRISEIVYEVDKGVFGMVNYTDEHLLKDGFIQDDRAFFTFELIPGPGSTGLPGPEIIVDRDYDFDLNTSKFIFAFRNTYLHLSEDFLRQMRVMKGVRSVEVSYAESLVFTGAQLEICPQPGYHVMSVINMSGNSTVFEDFSLGCVADDE